MEVPDDGPEGGPEAGLVVHAAGDQVGQLGPLGCRELQPFGVEHVLLWNQWGDNNICWRCAAPRPLGSWSLVVSRYTTAQNFGVT